MAKKQIHNPYSFGPPVEAEYFTDKTAQIKQLVTVMMNGYNLTLIVPSRYGKSSLLSKAIKKVEILGGKQAVSA